MRISDWSSDVCSSDLDLELAGRRLGEAADRVDQRLARILGGGLGRGEIERALAHLDGAAVTGTGEPLDREREGLAARSEEHTSELQSLMRISYAVLCLKKKKKLT